MDILNLAKEINKELGYKEGGVTASSSPALKIERFKTGSLTYDICTGGGVPIGRQIGIEGMESSGKTTISLLTLASYFKSNDDRPALFVDAEHAYDKKYAEKLGVDADRLLIFQPDNLEEASRLVKLVSEGKVGMVVFDSIKACLPQKIIDEGVDSHNIGLHAKMMGLLIGSVNATTHKNKITVIWINQQRENPGGYGGGKVSPGGNALKFYASIRIEVFRGSKKVEGEGHVNEGWIRVIKNKTAPPYQEGKYTMRHGTGICVSTEVLTYGVVYGVLYKKGHSYYYDETFENDEEKRGDHVMLGKGKDSARLLLDDNLELRDQLYDIILETALNNDE
jgi:recombination protein RecA